MKLNNFCLVVLLSLLWSTGVTAGTVNLDLADVGELAENIHKIEPRLVQLIVNYRAQHGNFGSIDKLVGVRGIGLTIIRANRGVIVVKDASLQTQIDVTSD